MNLNLIRINMHVSLNLIWIDSCPPLKLTLYVRSPSLGPSFQELKSSSQALRLYFSPSSPYHWGLNVGEPSAGQSRTWSQKWSGSARTPIFWGFHWALTPPQPKKCQKYARIQISQLTFSQKWMCCAHSSLEQGMCFSGIMPREAHFLLFSRKFSDLMATSITQKQAAFQGSLWNTKLSQVKMSPKWRQVRCQLLNNDFMVASKLTSFSVVLKKYKVAANQMAAYSMAS